MSKIIFDIWFPIILILAWLLPWQITSMIISIILLLNPKK